MRTTTTPTTRTAAGSLRTVVAGAACSVAALVGTVTIAPVASAQTAPAEAAVPEGAPKLLTGAEYDAAMAELRERHPWAFEDDAASSTANTSWAHELGKAVFSGAVGSGFDAWIDHVFGSADDQALAEITSSLNDIRVRMADIEDAIARLAEGVDRNAFISAEGHAKTYAADIRAQLRLIDGWESGHTFTDADVQHMVNVSYTAVQQLETHLLGPHGTYQLLTKLATHHSSRADAFEQMEEYRAGYRAALATGLLNLEWAADHDPKHENQLQIAGQTAHSTAEALYDVGILSDRYTASRDTRVTRSNGNVVTPNYVFGSSGQWTNIRFDAGDDTLPMTMRKQGRLMVQVNQNAYNRYHMDFWTLDLTVDPIDGTVTGTGNGRIHSVIESGPTVGWDFTTTITGTVDLHGTGRMVLDLPVQHVTGHSNSAPLTHTTLVLDPS